MWHDLSAFHHCLHPHCHLKSLVTLFLLVSRILSIWAYFLRKVTSEYYFCSRCPTISNNWRTICVTIRHSVTLHRRGIAGLTRSTNLARLDEHPRPLKPQTLWERIIWQWSSDNAFERIERVTSRLEEEVEHGFVRFLRRHSLVISIQPNCHEAATQNTSAKRRRRLSLAPASTQVHRSIERVFILRQNVRKLLNAWR